MDLDQLFSALSELPPEPAISGLLELLGKWKVDDSTVTELENAVERFIGNVWFTTDSLHGRVYELWSKFRGDAIRPIGGMTMNERLSRFSLFDRYDSRPTDKLVIYRKLLARP